MKVGDLVRVSSTAVSINWKPEQGYLGLIASPVRLGADAQYVNVQSVKTGGTGVIVENDNTFVSLPNSPNWFRVIWTDSQTSLTGESWLKEQQIEVLNESR